MILSEIYWNKLFSHNYIRIFNGGICQIDRFVSIKNTKIFVYPNAQLIIHKNAIIKDAEIHISKGCCIIGSHSIIMGSKRDKTNIIISNGKCLIGHHTKLSNKRIWIRFGGILEIGDYTNINTAGEIRCDNRIKIGSYNQISYNVRIWDTNTHSIYPPAIRRKMTEDYYPYYGHETSTPKTAEIIIGDDCWLGENCSILKGSHISNEVIIGYGCTIIGEHIPTKKIVVPEVKNKILNITY